MRGVWNEPKLVTICESESPPCRPASGWRSTLPSQLRLSAEPQQFESEGRHTGRDEHVVPLLSVRDRHVVRRNLPPSDAFPASSGVITFLLTWVLSEAHLW